MELVDEDLLRVNYLLKTKQKAHRASTAVLQMEPRGNID